MHQHPMQPVYDGCLYSQHKWSTIGDGVTVKRFKVHADARLSLFARSPFVKGECTAEALQRSGRDTHITSVNHELHIDSLMTPKKRGLPARGFATANPVVSPTTQQSKPSLFWVRRYFCCMNPLTGKIEVKKRNGRTPPGGV